MRIIVPNTIMRTKWKSEDYALPNLHMRITVSEQWYPIFLCVFMHTRLVIAYPSTIQKWI